MEHFLDALKKRRLLFDGSMGALLSSMGYRMECPERINLEHPDVIQEIHRRYLDAGCDVVITNSLGSSPVKLRRMGLSEKSTALTEAAIRNAQSAAAKRGYVALDIGPSGEMLAPVGTLCLDAAIENFAACARVGAAMGVDVILLETMTDIAECRAACLAARDLGIPVIASFTFDENGRNLTGGTPECAALTLLAAGAAGVGINCSVGPAQMLGMLKSMRRVTDAPICIQPNAGLPTLDAQGHAHYPYTAEMMRAPMESLLREGAAAIGGCCGTTPEHIRLFAGLDLRDAPAPSWDGIQRICSTRKAVPLAEALATAANIEDADDLYELEPEQSAAILSLQGLSPAEAAELTEEAQTASHVPLIFRANDALVLAAALRVYAGCAAVIAPESCLGAAARYGALRA